MAIQKPLCSHLLWSYGEYTLQLIYSPNVVGQIKLFLPLSHLSLPLPVLLCDDKLARPARNTHYRTRDLHQLPKINLLNKEGQGVLYLGNRQVHGEKSTYVSRKKSCPALECLP